MHPDESTALKQSKSGRNNLIHIVLLKGYGFLSENATFVDICNDHSLEFIGPKSDQIRMMGDKSTARDTMKVHSNYLYRSNCQCTGFTARSLLSSSRTPRTFRAWNLVFAYSKERCKSVPNSKLPPCYKATLFKSKLQRRQSQLVSTMPLHVGSYFDPRKPLDGKYFIFWASCPLKLLVTISKSLLVQAAGVPTVPGSDGLIKDEEDAMHYAEKVDVILNGYNRSALPYKDVNTFLVVGMDLFSR